jgi:threonine dehydratase
VRRAGTRAPRRRGGPVLSSARTSAAIPLEAIERAREITADAVHESPLVRLDVDAPCEIWLKLECLQPIGSFKLRGATSAIRQARPEEWRAGVWTTSAGNMAQGVCWVARELGVPATVVAPDHAPRAKLDAIARLGGEVIPVPFDTWWETIERGAYPGLEGMFVHPVLDERVMAGNGVIGLELAERLDGIDTVLVPWGGGGLTCGIASALAAVSPTTRVVACEPATGAPLSASLREDVSTQVEYTASFVDGAGSKTLLPAMWERARSLVSAAIALPLEDVAEAVRVLATRAHVVAEGAGALAVAAALGGRAGDGRVVCIVSGGNIDADRLTAILAGRVPG